MVKHLVRDMLFGAIVLAVLVYALSMYGPMLWASVATTLAHLHPAVIVAVCAVVIVMICMMITGLMQRN